MFTFREIYPAGHLFLHTILTYIHTSSAMISSYNDFNMLLLLGNITTPKRVQEAMQMQVEAERKKRAAVLESEGQLISPRYIFLSLIQSYRIH